MVYSTPLPEIPLWTRKGTVSGWDPMYGAVPGRWWAAPDVSPLVEVRDACSTLRALFSLGLLQPVGLMPVCGRAQPLGCLGA